MSKTQHQSQTQENQKPAINKPAPETAAQELAPITIELAQNHASPGLPATSNNLTIRQTKVIQLQKSHGNEHVTRTLGKSHNNGRDGSGLSSNGSANSSSNGSLASSSNGHSNGSLKGTAAVKKPSPTNNGRSPEAAEAPGFEGLEGSGGGPKTFVPVPPALPDEDGEGSPDGKDALQLKSDLNGHGSDGSPANFDADLAPISSADLIQRCPECGKLNCGCSKETVQRSPDPSPLDSNTQARLEQATGQSLNGVSVHHDDTLLAGRGQLAEAEGDDIYLAPQLPGPETELGSRVRLHEATHVLQSRQPDRPLDDTPEGTAVVESEAHEVARAAQRGEKAPVQTAADGRRRKGWEWPSLDDIAEMGEGALMSLVSRISSGLAQLIREGPVGMLTDLIKKGVKSFIGSIAGAVDFDSIVSTIKGVLDAVMRQFDGKDDPENCGAFARVLMKIRNLGQQLKQTAAYQMLASALGKVRSFIDKAKSVILEPAFDVIKTIAGGVWSGITSLANTIKGWFNAAKRVAGRVWTFVKGKLGFGEGESVTDWLKEKAKSAWESIKQTFAPAVGPLKTVGTIIVATNPALWPPIIIHYLPEVLSAVEWLWANRSNPDIIRSARKQNHGTLAKLLSAGQSLGQGISSVADTIISTLGKLSAALLNLVGGIAGVPLLSMAKSIVQKASDGIKKFLDWVKSVFKKGAAAVKNLFNSIKAAVKPYMDILMSIGLAIANPPMIPVILAGWAWRKLDNCYKPPIVDFLLDIVIGALEALPSMPMLGPLWPLTKNFVIGFLKGVKGQTPAMKIKVTNKVAKILSSPSIGFITGLIKGILTGIWEGLTDPFKLIYMVLKGLSALVTWAENIGGQAVEGFKAGTGAEAKAGAAAGTASASGDEMVTIKRRDKVLPSEEIVTIHARKRGPQTGRLRSGSTSSATNAGGAPGSTAVGAGTNGTAPSPAAAPAAQSAQESGPSPDDMVVARKAPAMAGGGGTVEGERLSNKQIGELTGSFRSFAADIKGPAEEVATNFMPAVEEQFKKSEGLTLDGLITKLGNAWTSAMGAIQGLAADIAGKVFQFFAGNEAESKIGEGVGWLIGTVIFEVILGVLTAGTWTAASPVMRAIQKFAKVLDWTGEVMGVIFKGLGKLGSLLFKGKGILGDLLSKAGAAAAKLLDPLEKLAKKILKWADEMLAKFGGKAVAKELGEEAAETGAKKLGGEALEEAGEQAGKEAGEEIGEAAGEKSAKEAGGEAGEEAGEKAGKEAGGEAGEDAGKEAGAKAGGEAGEEAGEKAGKEAGEETGAEAGKQTGKEVGGEAGEEAGEQAGKQAGEEMGEEAGEQAGKKAGAEAGEEASEQAGKEAGEELGGAAGKPPKEGPPTSSADEFTEALGKGGPEAAAKGRKVMEEAGDIKSLRKRVADGEFGDPEAAAKALFDARKQIIEEAQEKVSAQIAKDHPGIKLEFDAPGTPKFTSDVDVRAIAKCEKRVELEKLIKEGPVGDDALKALDDMGLPKDQLDELKGLLKEGKLTDKDIGKYLSPEDIKREINASLDASEAFYSKEVLGDADKAYDANFYTELRGDDLLAKASPAEKAKLLHDRSPVSMAEMKRNMSPEDWADYKAAQLDAMAKVDDADGLARLKDQFDEAERIAADLEGKSLKEVKDELRKVLDDPSATPEQIQEAMAKVKLMEPDAYGTDAAVKDIVDHLQTASRQSDKMKDAIEEATKARGLDPEKLKLKPDGTPVDPKYIEDNYDKLMDLEREIQEKFGKELEDIADLRHGTHGFEPGSAEHVAFLTQEASANMGKLYHAGTPSAQAKYLERIRYAAREAGVDVAGDMTDRELRAMITAKNAPNPDEAVDAVLKEWADRTGRTGNPAELRKAWEAEAKNAAKDTVVDMRTFAESEYQNKVLMEEIEGSGEAGAKAAAPDKEPVPVEAPGAKSADETPAAELPAAKGADEAAELPGAKGADEAAELPSGKSADQELDLPGSKSPDSAPAKADEPDFEIVDGLSAEKFKADEAAQKKLFNDARTLREEQEKFAEELMGQANIKGEAYSILKRDEFDDFVAGILEKMDRKGYTSVYQMDDIVRGRMNLDTFQDVLRMVNALKEQKKYLIKEIVAPRAREGVSMGYPRFHVVLKDMKTGLTHEWQIGTQAVTHVFEKEGIRIPKSLKLKEGMHADIHDIEYDIFKAVQEKHPELAESLGIPGFRKKVAETSAEAGAMGTKMPEKELDKQIDALHEEASLILEKLVETKGPKWVEQFYH